MSQPVDRQWAVPSDAEPPPEELPADPYRQRLDTGADEVAPVDRQADPAHWLPGKALVIAAVVVGAALLATIVICLVVWLTPPMHHLQVPAVPKG